MTLLGLKKGRSARRVAGYSLLSLAICWTGGASRAEDGLPVLPASAPAVAAASRPDADAPRADAGDDQIGLVGRRITLNAGKSTPRGAALRWFALSGPKVEGLSQDASYLSFTPTASGTYRFGLVAATARGGEARISEMDEVVVTVGEVPSAVIGGGGAGIPAAAIDEMLRGPGAAAGRSTLEQAAGVFDAIATRASLYTSFADLSAELMRRLDAVIPTDPGWRRYWAEGVFAPLTQHLVAEMQATGLDLRSAPGQGQPLGQVQRERLQALFATYAREFRSRAQVR